MSSRLTKKRPPIFTAGASLFKVSRVVNNSTIIQGAAPYAWQRAQGSEQIVTRNNGPDPI